MSASKGKGRRRSHPFRRTRHNDFGATPVGPRAIAAGFRVPGGGRKPGRWTAPIKPSWHAIPPPSDRCRAEMKAAGGASPGHTRADAPPADPWEG